MKVLFVSNDPRVFDSESKVRARVESYAAHMEHLSIVSPGKETRVTQVGNITLYSFNESRIGYLFWLPLRIRNIVHKERIDVVSAQDPFEHGLMALVGTWGTQAVLHLQLHTDPFAKGFVSWSMQGMLNRVRRVLLACTLPRAHHVRVVSPRLEREIHARWKAVSVRVLPVPVQEFQVSARKPLNLHSCITIGRLTAEKNISDIISAFAIVALEFPDANLTIVGDGPYLHKLKEQVELLAITQSVQFIPYQTEVMNLLKEHAIYVQASSYEGYGLTLIEAGLAGLPIISTDVGVIGDILKKEYSVLTFELHDIQALSRHMTMLFSNPHMQESLGEESKRSVSMHLSSQSGAVVSIVEDLQYALTRTSL